MSWPTSVEDEEDGNVNGDLDVEDDVDGLSLVLVRLGGFSSMISIRGGGRLGGVDLRRRVGHDRIGLSILPAFDIEGLEEIGSHFIVWLCGQIGGDQEKYTTHTGIMMPLHAIFRRVPHLNCTVGNERGRFPCSWEPCNSTHR